MLCFYLNFFYIYRYKGKNDASSRISKYYKNAS